MKKFIFILIVLFSYCAYGMPTAVLFDCDGVIVDTEYMKFAAWQEALKDINIDLTVDDYKQVVGESSEAIAKKIMQTKQHDFDSKTIIKKKNALYKQEQIKGVPPILEAVTYLNNLLEQKDKLKIKIAIVSSDSHEAILRNLKFAQVKYELLDGIFSGHDDLQHIHDPSGTNKPKPYIYQLAAEKLAIDPKSTIVFEDTSAGIAAATGAGMIAIAVPNSFTKNQDFSQAARITSFNRFNVNLIN